MLIKKLKLNNFRQYIGEQEIDFSTDKEKNVTVLIGVNTSGKTTFIRAFEWILYGINGFGEGENKTREEREKEKILLNSNVADKLAFGDSAEVSGTLVIEHNDLQYEIVRTEKYTSTGSNLRPAGRSASIYYLQPDGQTRTKIEGDFEDSIEGILPKALSSYFFFGGERLGSIASQTDIESSVKGLMGLDILFNARDHLKKVVAIFRKNIDLGGNQDAKRLQEKLDGKNTELEELKTSLDEASDQLSYYQSNKEKYAAMLKANDETKEKQNRREQLATTIKNLNIKIEEDKKDLVNAFSRNSFAFFSLPLLKEAIKKLNEASDQTESVPEMTADSIDYILKRGICICGTCISPGSAAENNLLAERKKQPPESIGSVVRNYREQASTIINSNDEYYSRIEKALKNLRSDKRDLGFREDEKKKLDDDLRGAKDNSNLEIEYQNSLNRVNEFQRKKDSLVERIGSAKKEIENYQNALDKQIAASKENARTQAKIDYTQAVYEWVDKAYKERESIVRSNLEEKVNNNFARIYHGHRTISIDEKYRVKYIDVTTEESDGLKAVKSFAFVSGLVDLAKESLTSESSKEADIGPQYFPLVMDAPFSNVDEIHIENISRVIPESAEQVIIAVMQKDWEPASKIMSPYVGKAYYIEKAKDSNGKDIDTITHIKRRDDNVI